MNKPTYHSKLLAPIVPWLVIATPHSIQACVTVMEQIIRNLPKNSCTQNATDAD